MTKAPAGLQLSRIQTLAGSLRSSITSAKSLSSLRPTGKVATDYEGDQRKAQVYMYEAQRRHSEKLVSLLRSSDYFCKINILAYEIELLTLETGITQSHPQLLPEALEDRESNQGFLKRGRCERG